MRIAVDAMGGDHAPDEVVKGAIEAADLLPDATVILVGQSERILPLAGSRRNVVVHHASEIVGMQENPSIALRKKPDSSVRVGLTLVKQGKADAIISAGNTGALVGGATVPLFGLGVLDGVKRPGIAVPFPTDKGFCALVDAGANKNAKAIHLLQYAVMGSVYIKTLRKEDREPTIALLNIGEESNKGTDLHKEAHALLAKSLPNFIGNVEPHKVFMGAADVVVSDGFTGNVFLKTTEGASRFMMDMIRSNGFSSSEDIRAGVAKVENRLDYSAVGGAPVLGCRGIVIKCHGRSGARAITNAVKLTADFIRHRLNDHIVAEVQRHQQTRRGWFGWFAGATAKDKAEDA